MAATSDGSGTITQIGRKARKIFPSAWINLGYSVAIHCFTDLAAMGVEPKIFLNYLASEKINPQVNLQTLTGMIKACKETNCILLGGETAELPGIFRKGENDIAGFAIGFSSQYQTIIAQELIRPGDSIIGISSNGVHLNGLSLVRKNIFKPYWFFRERRHYRKLIERIPNGTILAAELLTPMPNYAKLILVLVKKIKKTRKNHRNRNDLSIHGLAHITGGGLKDNIERLLPENCRAKIYKKNIDPMPIFQYIQKTWQVSEEQMFKTFNMGIGFVIIAPQGSIYEIKSFIKNRGGGLKAFHIGEITEGKKGVEFVD